MLDPQLMTEAERERALAKLRAHAQEEWRPFYCPRPYCDGLPHDDWEWNHARWKQHPPKGPWEIWANLSGRGTGKTRTASEWTHKVAKEGCTIALIAPTASALRDVIVEGESGILAKAPPGFVPEWEPTKKRLTWPNGSTAFGFSAEEPDRLRGPQFHCGLLDEPAHMPLIEDVWGNYEFALRLKHRLLTVSGKTLLSSTPKPIKWLKDLLKEDRVVVTRESTFDNVANLDPRYIKRMRRRYEGTRIGKQELFGEILEDTEGAMWNADLIRHHHMPPRFLTRIVVAIDPAGTAGRRSDETGIVAPGVLNDNYYVIADVSGKYSPLGWANKAIDLYEYLNADAIVVEITYGRDLVTQTIATAMQDRTGASPRIITVDSRRGKMLRAEPVVAAYEQGRVYHDPSLKDGPLETQQLEWIPGVGSSPDRVDALVHGITELASNETIIGESSIASLEDAFRSLGIARPPGRIYTGAHHA